MPAIPTSRDLPFSKGSVSSMRWLVIAHEASNSGAPRMLLEILRGVRAAKGPDWNCEMIFDHGGALLDDFGRLGRIRILSHSWTEGPGLVARFLRRTSRWFPLKTRRFTCWVKEWHRSGSGVIYSNTGTNGRLLAALPEETVSVVSHIHELAYGLHRFCRPRELAFTLSRSDAFLAVSSAVVADLNALGVADHRIGRIPNFVTTMPHRVDLTKARDEICRRLGVRAGTKIISACGHVDWVKGTDMFVEVANCIVRDVENPPVFVWLGGNLTRGFARAARSKLTAGARSYVHFIGEVDDVSCYFSASEVVLVTSRVESFSRVALEAGAAGRPVLAFAAARGPADLLDPDCLVLELSAPAMASALEGLLASPEDADFKGSRLRDRIAEGFTAAKWIGKIIQNVEKPERG